ncbi:hypothetical protein HYV69_01000 [Candidatus Uhrbacteria bacterium]|nr:hypothetical protein [Candidatus Uhrbacteria bacterium]
MYRFSKCSFNFALAILMIVEVTYIATRFLPDLVSQYESFSNDDKVIYDPVESFGNHIEIDLKGDEWIPCGYPNLTE